MSDTFIYTTALKKVRAMTARIKVIPGGSSAGKTYSILPILIDKCIREKGLSVSIVSESMPHLRRGAMRDFLNIMKLTNRYHDPSWNKTNSLYTFSNGSYIEFFPADDDSKMRGARRNVLFINECNNVSEEAYTQLAMRTTDDIYLDYNPSHRFWVAEVIDSADSEKLTLTYRDNEALTPNVIKFLEGKRAQAVHSKYWENWCRVYLDGLEGNLEGTIFNEWRSIEVVPEDATLIGYGLDWGFTNDPSTCIAIYKYNGALVLDEILYGKGLGNNDIAKLLSAQNIKSEIIADSAEPKSIAELKRYGFNIRGAKKGRDSIVYGLSIMLEQELFVTRRSTHLREELDRYTWKKDREGNALNVPIDAWNHCIDAVRYLVMTRLGKRSEGVRKPFKIG